MVLLSKKRQILGALEVAEGVPATLTAVNGIYALDATIDTPQEFEERETTGATLSPDIDVPGRSTFTMQFSMDFFGLGAVTVPPSDIFLRACGLRRSPIAFNAIAVIPPFPSWPGQTLSDGLDGTAILAAPIGQNGLVYFRSPTGGFPNDLSWSTPTSGVFNVTGVPTVASHCYSPDSTTTAVVVVTGAWTGLAPVVGEVISNGITGEQAARAVVVSIAGTLITITPALTRPFLAGETLTGLTGLGTNTVHATGQYLERNPTATLRANIDGYQRTGTGCRGTYSIELEAGKTGKIRFDFSGSLYSHGDAVQLTGVAFPTVTLIPRWQNAKASIDGFEIPLTRLTLTGGNTVTTLGDAHGANGIRGAAITARSVTIAIDPDQVSAGVYNYIQKLQAGTPFSFYTLFGPNIGGEKVSIHVPRAQMRQRRDGDRDGVFTADIEANAKRETADGDNEVFICFGI